MENIDLASKYSGHVDELFKNESKRSLLTNQDYDWSGAHSIRVYTISTSPMSDYDRNGANSEHWSRYGEVKDLSAITEELTLRRDRSFTFCIDALDSDETGGALAGATALARQLREVCVPEIDGYTYNVMADGAGHKPAAVELTPENIYQEILKASEALDDSEIPETNRVLLVNPTTYALLKRSPDVVLDTDVGQEMRLRGVIGVLDGSSVVKAPRVRLPENFGFMLVHPSAAVCPLKLESYKIHQNPPGISGSLIEGRLCYDCFILSNKKSAIFYQQISE